MILKFSQPMTTGAKGSPWAVFFPGVERFWFDGSVVRAVSITGRDHTDGDVWEVAHVTAHRTGMVAYTVNRHAWEYFNGVGTAVPESVTHRTYYTLEGLNS